MNKLIEKYLPDYDYIKKNAVKQYRTITIKLTVAHIDKVYRIPGNCLTVNTLTPETDKYAKVRINSKENELITLVEGRRIETTIHSIYITNNAYASGEMELVIGIDFKVK